MSLYENRRRTAANLVADLANGPQDPARLERIVAAALNNERFITLQELIDRGCPHGCVPPCPYHRRLQESI